MRGRNLDTNTGLAFGYHREIKANYVNTFFQQTGCELLRQKGIVQHNGNDGVDAWLDIEAGSGHFFAEIERILFQLVPQTGGLAQQIEYGDGRPGYGGSKCIGEQVWPGPLAKQVYDLFSSTCESA